MNKRLIALDQIADSKEQAVRIAGKLLYDEGYVSENYVDQMVELLDEFGPYIVITKHVAMPHARPQDGALRSGFSLVRLKNAIDFGSVENDPVRYVIGLSAATNREHLQTIQKICEILENKRIMKTLEYGTIDSILTEMEKENV